MLILLHREYTLNIYYIFVYILHMYKLYITSIIFKTYHAYSVIDFKLFTI
jgi:hypothetical protein